MNITCPECGNIVPLEPSREDMQQHTATVGEECENCGAWLAARLAWVGEVVGVLDVWVVPPDDPDDPDGDEELGESRR